MRGSFIALGAMLVLAACGQGSPVLSDRAQLEQTCVAEGEDKAVCACIAGALQANLPAELFRKTAVAVGKDRQDMMTFVGELSDKEQTAFALILDDLFACSPTGAGG